ncbi:MAG: hypothetical protein ACM30I_07945 [Gemmatimonas sp.]
MSASSHRARRAPLASLALLLAVAMLALAACDDVAIVEDQTTGRFSPNEYARDAALGPIPVTILGSALGAGDERLAAAVMDEMRNADWAPHASFVLAPADEMARAAATAGGGRMYSYVLMFNGPANVTAAALCARKPLPPATAAGNGNGSGIRLVAGLCRNDEIATAVTGRAYRVSGFDDDRFHRLIVGVMQTLTRPNQPQINR